MLSTLTYAVRVEVSPEQSQTLSDTCAAYLDCCNMVSETVWEHRTISQKTLHQLAYRKLRDEYHVGAQMAQSSIIRVVGDYRTIKGAHGSLWATSQPNYHSLGYDLVWNRDYSILKDGRLSINTIDGRIKLPVDWTHVPERYHREVRYRKVAEPEWEVAPAHPQHRGTTRPASAATGRKSGREADIGRPLVYRRAGTSRDNLASR